MVSTVCLDLSVPILKSLTIFCMPFDVCYIDVQFLWHCVTQSISLFRWMDEWMDDFQFYILFNSISVTSGEWVGGNERLDEMEPCLWLKKNSSSQAELESGTTRSAGHWLTNWDTGAPVFKWNVSVIVLSQIMYCSILSFVFFLKLSPVLFDWCLGWLVLRNCSLSWLSSSIT